MNRIVIDLEMCRVPAMARKRGYRGKNEIIQIGAVKLDENFEETDRFCSFVHPEFGRMDSFITNLTGIRSCEIKDAVCLKDALHSFLDWIGEGETRFYAWSESDYFQIKKELEQKGIEDEAFGILLEPQCWIDYQRTFSDHFEMGRQVGLEEALALAEVDARGRAHDGLVDASNTGRLICRLEQNPGLAIPEYLLKAREEETDHLSVSMAGLFANICLT